MPTVSVVMAAYNASAFIKETIESILDQDFTDFEFIIVDDASTDDTADIIQSFNDARIVYIKQSKNGGQTPALNLGIQKAQGQYIARIDADDISMPRRFKFQVDFMNAHPEVGVVGTWQQTIDVNGIEQGIRRFPLDAWDIKAGLITASPLGWFSLSHPTVMIRKVAIDQVGYFDESLSICQDYDLWVRMSQTYQLANIPVVGIKYRAHGQSLSQKNILNTKSQIERVIRKNIEAHLPNVTVEEQEYLTNMLLFNAPKSKAGNALELFDQFFDHFMLQPAILHDSKRGDSYARAIKAYYAPQLLKKDLKLALRAIGQVFMRDPKRLFTKRFAACLWYSIHKKW